MRVTLLILPSLALLSASMAAAAVHGASDSAHYRRCLPPLWPPAAARGPPPWPISRRCLADSSPTPAMALADAEIWAKAAGGVPAQHCAALALVSRNCHFGKRQTMVIVRQNHAIG